jgi:hypothetical protein
MQQQRQQLAEAAAGAGTCRVLRCLQLQEGWWACWVARQPLGAGRRTCRYRLGWQMPGGGSAEGLGARTAGLGRGFWVGGHAGYITPNVLLGFWGNTELLCACRLFLCLNLPHVLGAPPLPCRYLNPLLSAYDQQLASLQEQLGTKAATLASLQQQV